MIKKSVKFKVKENCEDSVVFIINEFLKAVKENEPETIYESYKSSNEREFINLITFPNYQAELNHKNAAYTRKFVEKLYKFCEELPQFVDLYSLSQE